jgi:hypothetical protein
MRRTALSSSPWLAVAAACLLAGCGSGGGPVAATVGTPTAAAQTAAQKAADAEQAHQVEQEVQAAQGAKTVAGARAAGLAALEPPQGPGGGDRPFPATYSGNAQQRGSVAADNTDYGMLMRFSPDGSGTVRYPELGCSGTLTLVAVHPSSRQYDETITAGHCRKGGIWTVRRVSSNELTGVWTRVATTYEVDVDLVA